MRWQSSRNHLVKKTETWTIQQPYSNHTRSTEVERVRGLSKTACRRAPQMTTNTIYNTWLGQLNQRGVVSDFRHEVDEICTLMGY